MRMGKSYSVDLRLRVVGAIDNGMSKMAAHQLFQVSRSTIDTGSSCALRRVPCWIARVRNAASHGPCLAQLSASSPPRSRALLWSRWSWRGSVNTVKS